jgi:hypothetical protein
VVTLGVELDQGLRGFGVHLVADARSPDRLAVGVELEVAIGRTAIVSASYRGLIASEARSQSRTNRVRGPNRVFQGVKSPWARDKGILTGSNSSCNRSRAVPRLAGRVSGELLFTYI